MDGDHGGGSGGSDGQGGQCDGSCGQGGALAVRIHPTHAIHVLTFDTGRVGWRDASQTGRGWGGLPLITFEAGRSKSNEYLITFETGLASPCPVRTLFEKAGWP